MVGLHCTPAVMDVYQQYLRHFLDSRCIKLSRVLCLYGHGLCGANGDFLGGLTSTVIVSYVAYTSADAQMQQSRDIAEKMWGEPSLIHSFNQG